MSTPTRTTTRSAGTKAAIRTRSSRHSIYLSANPDVKAAGVNPLDALRPDRLAGRPRALARLRSARSISRPIRTSRPRMSIRSAHFLQHRRAARAASRSRRRELIAAERLRLRLLSAAQSRRRGRARRSVPALPDHRLEGRAQSERAVRHRRLSCDLRRRGGGATSIRSITTTSSAGTRGAIRRSASTRPRISRPIRTWRPRTSIRWCTSSSSASRRPLALRGRGLGVGQRRAQQAPVRRSFGAGLHPSSLCCRTAPFVCSAETVLKPAPIVRRVVGENSMGQCLRLVGCGAARACASCSPRRRRSGRCGSRPGR